MHLWKVLLMPNSLGLVWGHSVHFAKFPILRFSKHYSFNSFHQISTKLDTRYHNHTGCHFLKVSRHSVHFTKFPILQFLKLSSSPNFHPIHPNFMQGIVIIQAVTCQKLQKLWHFELLLTQNHMQL